LPSTTTTTTAPTGDCNASPPPASAINVNHADGDFNGDGTTDTLTVYGTGTVTQPSPYHLQIALGNSQGTIDNVIADAATDNSQVVKPLGGADITASAGLPPDGSGDEAFDGVRCDGTAGGQRLVALSAKSDDGVTYNTTETRLQVQAGAFTVLGAPITGTLDANDSQLQGFSALDCPGVQAP
jgi:hypothetical protein